MTKSTTEEPVETIISYGLGNFADCIIARYQLALLMALREHLQEGKRKTEVNTLYHMLHCGKSLYNNLLWANLNPIHLHKMVIEPYVEETMLPDNFIYNDVFNDTAVVTFPQRLLNAAPQELWDNCTEPQYSDDDLEFIPNK
ncbi:hypothetical protein KUTeg_001888 [Tegillarca granosa]|uniref:SRR1-like domain-containing protein n=1 Tax=Tegillarca granosa TaxID=220873 RepID=A0ABQ9FSR4_TEGGR|nr:hypothetical protein KUTeg_001888 [Tegillarca granosa]